MFTKAELEDAINELLGGKHSVQNCEKLAAIYVVLDHLYAERSTIDIGYSNDNKIESEIGLYGDSDFLQTISGKPSREVLLLVNELVEALVVLNPKLVSSFFEKLNDL